MEFFIPWWGNAKLIAAALAGGLILAAPAYLIGHHKGAVAERTAIEAQAARNAFERIQNLEKNNEDFRNLPDRERCIAFMRDSGLPISNCDD
jgi:hypothetical protein